MLTGRRGVGSDTLTRDVSVESRGESARAKKKDKSNSYVFMQKKVFLVDAYALIYKYYYAFMRRPMRNRAGMNTSIVFGFTKFLRDIQKREHPDLLGVAFDPKGGSFRKDIFPEYKANRPATPEDIIDSVPYIKRLLEAMCIPVLEV